MSGYFEIELSFRQPSGGTPEQFDAFLDSVLEELGKIGHEADVTASLTALIATFTLDATDHTDDTFIKAVMDLRAALHAADCGTPGWPDAHEILSARSVKATDLVDA